MQPLGLQKGTTLAGRNTQITRIYRILGLLEAEPLGLTALQISSKLTDRGFKVSKRTVYRDLEALKASGFPLTEKSTDQTQGTSWTLDTKIKSAPAMVLTASEQFTLFLAKGSLSSYQSMPFYLDLESVFQKIEDKLGKKTTKYFEELSAEIKFSRPSALANPIATNILEGLRHACSEKLLISAEYFSANSNTVTTRTLGPHYLYFSEGSLYLVAEEISTNTIKTFAVPRIQKLEVTNDGYTGKISKPQEHFGNSIGVFHGENAVPVQIRFHSTLAPFVSERSWHPSQKVTRHSSGEVSLHIDVAITPQLVNWVLGFGSRAKVETPQTLKDLVKAEVTAILNDLELRIAV